MIENQKKQGIISVISENKAYFFISLFIILTMTFSTLYLFGLVPESLKYTVGREPVLESKGNRVGELPLSIKIPSIGVNAQIYNPATTSPTVLDDYLLKGAVRYPGSGLLSGDGNIFIFGHSTGFKIVNNQAFKTFSGLKNLKQGDLVYVYSEGYEYTYKVFSVKIITADKALVEFNTNNKLLTLSTCDTFGAKSDRVVAQSEFVSKKSIRK